MTTTLYTIEQLTGEAYMEALSHVVFIVKTTIKKDVNVKDDVPFLEAVAKKLDFQFDENGVLRRIDYKGV